MARSSCLGLWIIKKKEEIPDSNTSLKKIFGSEQFVNFTTTMSKSGSPSERETAFALAALMEIPFQYKATLELRLLGYVSASQTFLPVTKFSIFSFH